MDYEAIKKRIFLVYEVCNVKSFPINCNDILETLEIKKISYSDLSTEIKERCFSCSDDAFIFKGIIYYNDRMKIGRMRFSLMHELGHILLGHKVHSIENEKAANFFAKYLLAPPILIHYANVSTPEEVIKLCNITLTCARYSLTYHDTWKSVVYFNGLSNVEEEIYNHFFDSESNRFIYKSHPCAYCNNIIYNSTEHLCPICKIPPASQYITSSNDLNTVRGQWLYGGI